LRALARKGVIELIPSTSRGIRLIQHAGIPVISRLHLGQPVLSEVHMKQTCKIDKQLFQPAIDFLIRVNTAQFKPFGILEEDYLAIHQYNPKEPIPLQKGQWIVVREANELVIQHLGTELDLAKTHIIEGIVVGVIRPLLTPSL
jgi:repressor LexA